MLDDIVDKHIEFCNTEVKFGKDRVDCFTNQILLMRLFREEINELKEKVKNLEEKNEPITL